MTRDYREGPKKPGDLGDPVADNIRRQQQRDAAPSAKEAKAEARRALAREGCTVCGEDDPDKLGWQLPVTHNCPAYQSGRPDPEAVCDDHVQSVNERRAEQAQQTADDADLPVALYECGISQTASEPQSGPVRTQGGYQPPPPKLDTECVCGAHIETLFYPSDDAE